MFYQNFEKTQLYVGTTEIYYVIRFDFVFSHFLLRQLQTCLFPFTSDIADWSKFIQWQMTNTTTVKL